MFFGLAGCYTMHFVKDHQPVRYTSTQWHHIGILGLVEFSDPVNLRSVCNGEDRWQAVRVQTGFLQGLVRWIPIPIDTNSNALVGLAIDGPRLVNVKDSLTSLGLINFSNVGTFYSPEEVSISCKL